MSETQSVCKHCGDHIEKRNDVWFSYSRHCVNLSGHEPLSEPVSTGEPPAHVHTTACYQCGHDDCPCHGGCLHEELMCIPAARPSEPPPERSTMRYTHPEVAGQMQANAEAAAPQASAEPTRCETCGSSDPSPGLCSSTWHLQNRGAAAPQPVSGDALEDWNTPEFAELVMGFAKTGKMLQGPERHIMNQIKNVFNEIDAERATRLAGDAPTCSCKPKPLNGQHWTGCPEGKVEEIAAVIYKHTNANWCAVCESTSSDCYCSPTLGQRVSRDAAEEILRLRPYFPPASQTVEKWPDYLPATGMGAVAAIMNLWLREFRSSPTAEQIRDAAKIIDSLLATPASTARTDGWVSLNDRLPEPSDDVYYEMLHGTDDRSFAYYDPAGAKKEGNNPDWCWFDREENAWCHKDRYTHWKPITAAPGSVPHCGAAERGETVTKLETDARQWLLEHNQKLADPFDMAAFAETRIEAYQRAIQELRIVKFVSDGDGDWIAIRKHGFDKLRALTQQPARGRATRGR